MSPRGRRTVLGAIGLLPAMPALPQAADPLGPARVTLTAGGTLVMLRHMQTDPGVGDPPGFRLDDCTTQRNLSAAGRRQARRLGELLAGAGVRVGAVRSSRWCRCLDTARLAFGRVEPWPLLDSFFRDRPVADAQTAALRGALVDWRASDTTVLVTHQVNITALTGEWAAMGEALLLRTDGRALSVVGRFTVPA